MTYEAPSGRQNLASEKLKECVTLLESNFQTLKFGDQILPTEEVVGECPISFDRFKNIQNITEEPVSKNQAAYFSPPIKPGSDEFDNIINEISIEIPDCSESTTLDQVTDTDVETICPNI